MCKPQVKVPEFPFCWLSVTVWFTFVSLNRVCISVTCFVLTVAAGNKSALWGHGRTSAWILWVPSYSKWASFLGFSFSHWDFWTLAGTWSSFSLWLIPVISSHRLSFTEHWQGSFPVNSFENPPMFSPSPVLWNIAWTENGQEDMWVRNSPYPRLCCNLNSTLSV
jgi:hypothetical protein